MGKEGKGGNFECLLVGPCGDLGVGELISY